MVTIKGIQKSGHYVVPINAVPFHIFIFNSKNFEVGQNRVLCCF